jgi:hypothetical protein
MQDLSGNLICAAGPGTISAGSRAGKAIVDISIAYLVFANWDPKKNWQIHQEKKREEKNKRGKVKTQQVSVCEAF